MEKLLDYVHQQKTKKNPNKKRLQTTSFRIRTPYVLYTLCIAH